MIAAEIVGSRVAFIPESGHSTYWEQPELFNRAVLDHVSTVK
jgi:pimeloyl-ACP methyl ester carboxylesterase